jgi:GMP synthase-like glutamine amidotransferase
MKIGILQAGHFLLAAEGGNPDNDALFRRLLDGHGFEFETWDVVDMEFPASPSDADGWIITGSKHGAYDDLPFIAPLEDLIRGSFAAKVPIVGICFGHQIVAQAMGGKVVQFAGGWRAGRETYDFEGEEVALTAWHQDQVVELPEGAEVIARSQHCEYAAMLYGRNALTIQAHPEYGRAELSGLIDIRGPHMPPSPVAHAAANIDAPLSNAMMADRIAAFFKVANG